MTPYLAAAATAGVALVSLLLVVRRAAWSVRRTTTLFGAYRRQLTAESALLAHRRATLVADLGRRAGRVWRHSPRTMR
jgi:hypothetical protein